MSRKDMIINDDIHSTIEIYGVVYHQDVFRQIAAMDIEGKTFTLFPTAEKFHGQALSIEIVDVERKA